MASHTSTIKTNLSLLAVFFIFPFIDFCHTSLSHSLISDYIYTSQDVLDIADHACFVGIPVTSDMDETAVSLLEVFQQEESVMIGRTDCTNFVWPSGQQLNADISSLPNDYLIAFAKLQADRECLSTNAIQKQRVPSFEIYSGNMDLGLVVDFINEVCITYRDKAGHKSVIGLHREEILRSIFHVENVSSVNMGKLVKAHERYCTTSACVESTDINGDKHVYHENEHRNIESRSDQMHTCEKIPAPSKSDFFHNYLKISKPVIITGATDDWPAISKWTNEFFRTYGDKTVHIKLTPSGEFEGVDFAYNFDNFRTFKIPPEVKRQLLYPDLVVVRPATANMKFSEFLDLVESVSNGTKSGISAYLEYSSIASIVPQLKEDIEEMEFFKKMTELRSLNIWLSDGNTLGKLHFDPYDNFLCQLSGRKEVILFAPHNNSRLYEAHIPEANLAYDKASNSFRKKTLVDSTSMVMSPVDITNPDFERFPNFADAYPMNCTIDEGEVLFMPAFWWHEVQSYPNKDQGRNLAVNFWYDPFLTKEFPCQECKLDVNPKYRHFL